MEGSRTATIEPTDSARQGLFAELVRGYGYYFVMLTSMLGSTGVIRIAATAFDATVLLSAGSTLIAPGWSCHGCRQVCGRSSLGSTVSITT